MYQEGSYTAFRKNEVLLIVKNRNNIIVHIRIHECTQIGNYIDEYHK